MSIIASYEPIKVEIATVRDSIKEIIKPGTTEDGLCKGFAVWFSELLFKPVFLFIGINPGAGYFKNTGIKYRETDLDPSDCFEYCEYGGKLAEETIEVFSKAGIENELEKSVKTNIHYLVTNNQRDLLALQGILIDKYDINMYANSEKWTKRIIDLVQPECIICEGAYSAARIGEYYDEQLIWENDACSFTIKNSIHVIGYKRRYAGILNKEELQKRISTVYEKISNK